MKLINHNSPEKVLLKDAFNSLSYMDVWVCSIIEGYIYKKVIESFWRKRQEYMLRYGKKEGKSVAWYEDGQLYAQLYYKDGKEEGETKHWYPNGQLHIQEYFKDGKREGEYKTWFDDGQLWNRSYFKKGMIDFDYKWLNEEGELVEHKIYENDEVVKDLLLTE